LNWIPLPYHEKRRIKKKEKRREKEQRKRIRLQTRIPAEGLFGNSYNGVIWSINLGSLGNFPNPEAFGNKGG
jgi:hypothetical protein